MFQRKTKEGEAVEGQKLLLRLQQKAGADYNLLCVVTRSCVLLL